MLLNIRSKTLHDECAPAFGTEEVGLNSRYFKLLAWTAILLLAVTPLASAQQNSAPNQATQQTQQPTEAPIPGQPTLPTINPDELPNNPSPQPAPAQNTSPTLSQRPATPTSAVPNQPTGTAAAQVEKPAGSAASRPAGAAIAPAKQRQVRSLLIKMGVIVGAGVALGTVYALSEASPARVPGSPAAH